MQQAILTWVRIEELLPPMDKIVLIHRFGGKNNHDDVRIGYRHHKYGTRDEWEWSETGGGSAYWGLSCDGSHITAWADMPVSPKTPNVI